MSEHVFPEGKDRCIHCNTWNGNPQRTLCPHRPDPAVSGMRPEPALRTMAVEDDGIAARLAELRAEREAGWNVVKGETE